MLVVLFVVQKRGTESVGRFFGPVMLVWFAVIGADGIGTDRRGPARAHGAHPRARLRIFSASPLTGFLVLGAVSLAITGGEALYADMGHFGRFPIRLAWFALVLPALVLNYFGQGALILGDKTRSRTRSFAWCRIGDYSHWSCYRLRRPSSPRRP